MMLTIVNSKMIHNVGPTVVSQVYDNYFLEDYL